tara:strand:+ start:6 stop:161 length:156 start_codon:yes stop_codon:yes gene_type:complete
MKKYTNVEFGLRQGKITRKYLDYSFNLDSVVELIQELTYQELTEELTGHPC